MPCSDIFQVYRKLFVWRALKWLVCQPWYIHAYIDHYIPCDSFLFPQRPLKTHSKHTRKHLTSARLRWTPHIPSAWAWRLTSPSSSMRSSTPQKKPANWLKRFALFSHSLSLYLSVLSCTMFKILTFSFLLAGIRRGHRRARPAKWGVLQRQHSYHAAPQRQPDSECRRSV